jgi:Cdc6-like AAA superfamily ATPase
MGEDASVFDKIKFEFEQHSGLSGIETELREREGSTVLLLKVANPTERLFRILELARSRFAREDTEAPLATLVKKRSGNLLQGAEGRLLLRTLAESLNINRYSFQTDFLARYTRSVAGAEEQITASANHVVYGRRGAGKSTLLLYALHTREKASRPSVWVDMQVYARRDDDGVISDVLCAILDQMADLLGAHEQYGVSLSDLKHPGLDEQRIRRLLPSLRRLLSHFAAQGQELFLFLDDFHVLAESLQPRLLDVLYAVCRGNNLFLKISAIETLTRTFDPQTKQGIEIPHDAQLVLLDYNLTIPEKATQHIEAILDSHAVYCGLPSVRRMCTSADVIPRLTWVAAGVPRDALNLFSQAMTKATLASRPNVSVSNVNVAASEAINTKLRELEADVSGDPHPLHALLEEIREFCVKRKRRNAFLVEIRSDGPTYEGVRKLVDLRLLHVINEGITIGEAGRKYLGLILDYGFYIGIRAARSVDLFNRQTGRVAYKDLRKLPVFEHLPE